MKQLFRGYIVKDWFSENELETKYTAVNEIFVSICVVLYSQCQKHQNKMVKADDHIKEINSNRASEKKL